MPWGFEVAASLFGRQGFPFVQIIRVQAPNDGGKNVVVGGAVDNERYDDVWNLDSGWPSTSRSRAAPR